MEFCIAAWLEMGNRQEVYGTDDHHDELSPLLRGV
jgi:hypothetical protein